MTARHSNLRTRVLKPEFFESKSLSRCSLEARLTFLGLWTLADDWGRGPADPVVVLTAIWSRELSGDNPRATAAKVAEWLDELEAVDCIRRWEVPGDDVYFVIPAWTKHQWKTVLTQQTPVHPAPPSEVLDPAEVAAVRAVGQYGHTGSTGSTGIRATKLSSNPSYFTAFWDVWPRKADKKAAEAKFNRIIDKGEATPEDIIAGAKRYAEDPNRDPEYTKLPTTWLNHGCWEDAPLPARNGGRQLGLVERMIEKERRKADG